MDWFLYFSLLEIPAFKQIQEQWLEEITLMETNIELDEVDAELDEIDALLISLGV